MGKLIGSFGLMIVVYAITGNRGLGILAALVGVVIGANIDQRAEDQHLAEQESRKELDRDKQRRNSQGRRRSYGQVAEVGSRTAELDIELVNWKTTPGRYSETLRDYQAMRNTLEGASYIRGPVRVEYSVDKNGDITYELYDADEEKST